MEFRALKANEIDCRISRINQKGLSLLLYKDARVDMRILDETVGPMNWKRSHQIIGGNLYCTIEIWDDLKQEWVSKEDVGTESYTEKEKGQASDSFKRAGFNWGIGRELYTAPFIWITAADCNIRESNGKYVCYDRFKVSMIEIASGNVAALEIVNEETGKVVFRQEKDYPIDEAKYKVLCGKCKEKGMSISGILQGKKPSEIMVREWMQIMNRLDA